MNPKSILIDHITKGDIDVQFIKTENQLTDIFTKALYFDRFCTLRSISIALSTAESEYIAAGSCVAQVLWLKQQILDLSLQIEKISIFCDNTSAICISKNAI